MTVGEILLAVALIASAYLIGAIPFGLVVGKVAFGVNLFETGSKSMGATNAFRTLGWKAGLMVFAADLLKGMLVTLVSGLAMPDAPWVQAVVAVVAVVGHSWSVFAGFKGGRGVATAFGAVLIIYPVAGLVAGTMAISIVIALRYVSLGSLVGTLTAVAVGTILYVTGAWRSPWGLVFMIPTSALIVWQHRPNLRRLAAGTELQMAEWPTYFASPKDRDSGGDSGK